MKRLAGLDIIRSAAIFSVVGVHFFLNTNYFYWPMAGKNMAMQTFAMWAFSICVPLFLMLTGYLMRKKELSWSFYKGIIPILCIYLFYSLASIEVREYYFKDDYTFMQWISQITTFKADYYSWYVNMYIGLFLLIPFLNMVLKGLKNAREHRMLILVLVFLTALPQFFNNIKSVFPNWWMNVYPLTYYFIGAYIGEYRVKINKALASLLFAVTILAETVVTLWFSKEGEFVGVVGDYGSVLIMVGAVLFFLIFYDMDVRSKAAKGIFTWISVFSFDIYLCSYITDRFTYKYVMGSLFQSQHQIIYYAVPAVTVSFLSALVVAALRYFATNLGKNIVSGIRNSRSASQNL